MKMIDAMVDEDSAIVRVVLMVRMRRKEHAQEIGKMIEEKYPDVEWNNEALHFFDEQLHAACMQVCWLLWSGTSLDEMKACALVHDDQCMLKLTGSFGIQPEIRL